jgi:protein-tyrosine phosphatase
MASYFPAGSDSVPVAAGSEPAASRTTHLAGLAGLVAGERQLASDTPVSVGDNLWIARLEHASHDWMSLNNVSVAVLAVRRSELTSATRAAQREAGAAAVATGRPAPLRHVLQMQDSYSEDEVRCLREGASTVAAGLAQGHGVVVCCGSGHSRGPAVAVAHRLLHTGEPLAQAVTAVAAAHGRVYLSVPMWRALMQLERDAGRAPSVTEADLKIHPAFALPPSSPMHLPTPAAGGLLPEFLPGGAAEARAAALARVFARQSMDWQDASIVMPRVWLGNAPAALSEGWLRSNRVDVVINCAAPGEIPPLGRDAAAASGVCAFHALDIRETPTVDAVPALLRGADLVHEALLEGRTVLVHCAAGMNRSVSTLAVYLMRYGGLDLVSALDFLKTKRPIAYPNREMYPRLLVAERALRGGAASVTVDDLFAHDWAPLPHWPLPAELAGEAAAAAAAATARAHSLGKGR